MDFSWDSLDSAVVMNPCYLQHDRERFLTILEHSNALPAHLWLSTSGSTVQKWVGLAKSAILASAKSVNDHLSSDQADIWINALPYFHVGGMGIYARADLSRATVFDFTEGWKRKWDASAFVDFIRLKRGTLTSLVPAQLHDLIKLNRGPPSSLRALIIGGGELQPLLYEKAVELGWPVLPSYGLTECASQVATAGLESWTHGKYPDLQLLNHIQARVQEDRLAFSGSSLLSLYAFVEGKEIRFVDPKVNGWYMSEDRGSIDQRCVTVAGRADSMIKVSGENVDLFRLNKFLQTLAMQMSVETEVVLFAMPDDRLGKCVHMAAECVNENNVSALVDAFNLKVLPFEKIRKTHCIMPLPRSPLGKIRPFSNSIEHSLE